VCAKNRGGISAKSSQFARSLISAALGVWAVCKGVFHSSILVRCEPEYQYCRWPAAKFRPPITPLFRSPPDQSARTRHNVKQLQVAWTFLTDAQAFLNNGSIECIRSWWTASCMPTATAKVNLIALDAGGAIGQRLWRFDPHDHHKLGAYMGAMPNRGVTSWRRQGTNGFSREPTVKHPSIRCAANLPAGGVSPTRKNRKSCATGPGASNPRTGPTHQSCGGLQGSGSIFCKQHWRSPTGHPPATSGPSTHLPENYGCTFPIPFHSPANSVMKPGLRMPCSNSGAANTWVWHVSLDANGA